MNNKQLLKKIEFIKEEQNKNWKNLIYGKGDLYQSYDELNIKGKRNTKKRIKQYELKKYLHESFDILDIGCNCGFIDLQISNLVFSVEGVEINPYLVKIGNKVKEHLNIKNVNFHNKSFEDFKGDGVYDVIFSFASDEVADGLSNLSYEDYIKKIVSLLNREKYLFYES